jgi:hypothetical protein
MKDEFKIVVTYGDINAAAEDEYGAETASSWTYEEGTLFLTDANNTTVATYQACFVIRVRRVKA